MRATLTLEVGVRYGRAVGWKQVHVERDVPVKLHPATNGDLMLLFPEPRSFRCPARVGRFDFARIRVFVGNRLTHTAALRGLKPGSVIRIGEDGLRV